MTATTKTTAAYAAALITFLFWLALVRVACRFDAGVKAAYEAGERIDHLDDALSTLNSLHVSLFGEEE